MKGVNAVIGTILLLSLAIAMVAIFMVFTGRSVNFVQSGASAQIENTKNMMGSCMSLDGLETDKIYVRNCGSGEIRNSSVSVYIDGRMVDISMQKNVNPGSVGEIIITENIPAGEHSIKVTYSGLTESTTAYMGTGPSTTISSTTTMPVTTSTIPTTTIYMTTTTRLTTTIPTTTTISATTTTLTGIILTSPNGGEIWQRGTIHTITWTYTGAISGHYVKLALLKAGVEIGTINASTPIGSGGYGSFVWDIYAASTNVGSDMKVRIQSLNQSTITDESNGNFTLTLAATTTTILSTTTTRLSTTTTRPATTTTYSGSAYGAGTTFGGYAIGGGAGYPTYSAATATYVVTTLSEFKSHMVGGSQPATAGQVVFVPSGYTINFNGNNPVVIPAGVIIASDRGYSGHSGAVLQKNIGSGGWVDHMLEVGGNNVRITGIVLEGEMYPRDGGGGDDGQGSGSGIPGPGAAYYLKGVTNDGYTGFEVDNCEIRGWAYAGIYTDGSPTSGRPRIHHNYIHHNQARSEGYGTNVNSGDLLVEANIFDYNRHDITGGGIIGEKYEFRYNIINGNGYPIGGYHVDVHENEYYSWSGYPGYGVACAGNYYTIHHNTVINIGGVNQEGFVHIRDVPQVNVTIYNNDIQTDWGGTWINTDQGLTAMNYGGQRGVIEQSLEYSTSFGRIYAINNRWRGTVYPSNTGILWEN